jgi:hypothetical protein
MLEQRRYHRLIEQKIDIFVDICNKIVTEKGLSKKVWVFKDELMSVVGIGDPDKSMVSKDYGFVFYYEMILDREMGDVVEEFMFKLEHFIKLANTTDKFKVFRNAQEK